jgi:hypothetical protein
MTIKFFSITANPVTVSKNVNVSAPVVAFTDARPTANCSILSPVLLLTWSAALQGCNYAYIPDFGRFYFVGDITLMTGGRCAVPCYVDVLTSWEAGIKAAKGTVLRAENPKSKMMYDSKFPLIAKMGVDQTFFDNTPFTAANGYNYLLTVQGKEGATNGSE